MKEHYIQVNTIFSTGVKNTLLHLNVAVTALGEYFSDILGNDLKLIQSGNRCLNTINSCFFASQNASSDLTNFITFSVN